MDCERDTFEENEEGENIENDDDMYGDITEESKDVKSHSPKKRWKERHSGNSKDSYYHSSRQNSEENNRDYDDDDYSGKDTSRRSSAESIDQHQRRRSDDFSDEEPLKKSRKQDDEDRYLKSKQRKLKEKLRKMEAEDGEILEDGEIEDGEETGALKSEENSPEIGTTTNDKADTSFDGKEESGGELEDEDHQNSEDNSRRRDKHDRRRKHRDHRDGRDKHDKHDKRRKSKEDYHKRKKRRPDYVDHDKVNDDEMQQAWLGGSKKNQSPKGSTRRQDSHGSHGHGSNRDHGRRDGGRDRDRGKDRNRDSYRGRRDKRNRNQSPSGPYDSPYDSPPGLYDSPSYDEEEDEEYQDEGYDDYKEDYNNKDKRKQKNKKSMMSLMQGDDYLDANIAVDEGENLYKKRDGKKKKNQNYNKRKYDRQHSEQPQKKKPLLETPMDERPVCRFYREGKCHKGDDCPFNHEYVQKKPELCKYYLGGSCSKGDDCIFMHSEYPCKFYHTGQECYQGDNCKFSHDEPSEDTAPIIERMNSRDHHHGGGGGGGEDEEYNRPKQGSPPQHVKEQMERIKKIPSLFDIQTFPPGQSPQKPPMQGVNNSPQQRMQGPNQGQPPRPVGFYNDTMQGGMRGPPPMGPQGQMNMGGPGQMGPQGPMQGPPMGGPMNMPPNSMGMNMVPPNSMGQMGGPGPMMQQGPMGPGNMGGPQIPGPQGPQMMNQPGMMGPQGLPMRPGGPQMNNPNMNPALAIVGAILRHVNPGMAPQVSQALSVQPDPRQGGMGILSPNHPGMDGSQDPRQAFNHPPIIGLQSPPQNSNMSQDDVYSPKDDDENTDPLGGKYPDGSQDSQIKKEIKADENEKKLAMMGLDLGSLSQLPAKQKELMMRLQQHGGQSEEEKGAERTERKDSTGSEDNKPKQKVDDDNWYSSDEEEGSAPKITDVLKNLTKKEAPVSEAVPPQPPSSTINVMQMINAIKSQSGPLQAPPPQVRDPRQPRLDPRTMSQGQDQGHMGFPHPADPRTFTSGLTVPPVNKWNSEPAIINSRPGDATWRAIRVTVDPLRKLEPPQGLNLMDPQFKNDPRIKKYLDYLNTKSHKENKNPHDASQDSKPIDPRSKSSAPFDPRLKKPGESTATDPRLQRTISENASSRGADPRMRGNSTPPAGVHNLPIRPFDPRSSASVPKASDPRLSRQMSHDSASNMVINVPKPGDPKLLPLGLAEIASPSPSDILASLQYPTDTDNNENKTDLTGVKKSSALPDPRVKPSSDISAGELSDQSDSSSSQSSEKTKGKLDYRNDPRFKVKTKPTSADAGQRRYGGVRKSSMDYSSPLDAESEKRDNTGYNSYNRPPPPNNPKPAIKDPRKQDPRTNIESEPVGLPELPDFIPPPEEENISTKKFFKQMDPTASPFC